MNMRKKSVLSGALALVLMFGLLPVSAFAAKEYVVWFESPTMDGSIKLEVEAGETIDPPSVPAKEDYYLEGWYRDPAFTLRWDFDDDTVEDDMTLYARWMPGDYYRTPYRYYYDGAYYYDGYTYFYGPDDAEYYYYNWLYYGGDPYRRVNVPTASVNGIQGQTYSENEPISLDIPDANVPSLLTVIVYPDNDRAQETVLKRGTAYTVQGTKSGITVTLQPDFLDTLQPGLYRVLMRFAGGAMATSTFTIE